MITAAEIRRKFEIAELRRKEEYKKQQLAIETQNRQCAEKLVNKILREVEKTLKFPVYRYLGLTDARVCDLGAEILRERGFNVDFDRNTNYYNITLPLQPQAANGIVVLQDQPPAYQETDICVNDLTSNKQGSQIKMCCLF